MSIYQLVVGGGAVDCAMAILSGAAAQKRANASRTPSSLATHAVAPPTAGLTFLGFWRCIERDLSVSGMLGMPQPGLRSEDVAGNGGGGLLLGWSCEVGAHR